MFIKSLITAIAAIILPIADIRFEYTFSIVAFEVSFLTVYYATRFRFVALVLAVRSAVAVPALGYADPAGLALELALAVALVGGHHGAAQLVTPVITIGYTVTLV